MREIKFRAWDKGKKWMVYDVQDAYDGLWSERNSDEVNDYYSYVSTFQSFTDEEEFNFMQYTGIKDKNGVEIYEGDIVDFDKWDRYKLSKEKYEIKWSKDDASFYGVNVEDKTRYISLNNANVGLKIIGNIFENPELLEVE